MYLLSIAAEHKNSLASIRHWDNLKLASKDNVLWLKGFTTEQINSVAIKQMPHKKIYEEKEQLLFRLNGVVPISKLPLSLLWSPIDIALPLDSLKYNHNFFGIQEKMELKLVPCAIPQKTQALLVEFEDLKSYIEKAPALRLRNLLWSRINQQILIFGEPTLPIKGQSFWLNHKIYMPSGLNFEFQSLSKFLSNSQLADNVLVYMNEVEYVIVSKSKIKPLTIGSFRLTFHLS